jgi:putative ABC transport system permease protein
MNVLNKLTLQSLLKNRTRTIVTIIGVVLSAAMITAVTTFVSSLQDYIIRDTVYFFGDWHVMYHNTDSEFVKKIEADNRVKEAYVTEYIGHTRLPAQKEESPVFFMWAITESAFENLPINLAEGRFPQNSNEVIVDTVSRHKIGDTLTLELVADYGLVLAGGYSYVSNPDDTLPDFTPDIVNTYTVVGTFNNTFITRGYSYYTAADSVNNDNSIYTAYVKLKNPHNVFNFNKEMQANSVQSELNRDYLRVIGVTDNENFYAVFYGLAAILIVLIMTASVLLIFNAFSISVSERTKQFGMLKSVGATGRQIMKSVLIEGFYIGIIGIPLGILAGIAGIGIALNVVMDILSDIMSSSSSTQMVLSVSWEAVAVAAAVAVVTIAVSVWIPALRASRISAIDSIRQTHDVKSNTGLIKTPRIIQKLLGVEGMLADKSFKRNKKRYRATVISLFVSVVLFIGASAFGFYLKLSADILLNNYPFDIMIQSHGGSGWSQRYDNETGEYVDMEWFEQNVDKVLYLELFDKYMSFGDVTDGSFRFTTIASGDEVCKSLLDDTFLEHNPYYLEEADDANILSVIQIEFIDDRTYLNWLKDLKLPETYYTGEAGAYLTIARSWWMYHGNTGRYEKYDFFKVKTIETNIGFDVRNQDNRRNFNESLFERNMPITMHIVDSLPWIWSDEVTGAMIFVPYSRKHEFADIMPQGAALSAAMVFTANNPTRTFDEMLNELPAERDETKAPISFWNTAEEEEHNRKLLRVINIGIYGFVILMSLITVANVFNTITTSVHLRRRELAMLKAIGMTSSSLNKMMMFECLFYGIKSLLFALPVSIGVTWLIYNAIMRGVELPFVLPWTAIWIAVAGVFTIVFVTMMYAIGKVKRENTVETLKSEVL